MRWFHVSVIVLLAAGTIAFSAQNLQMVDVSFLTMTVHTRLAVLIAFIYLVGALTGGSMLALVRRSFEGARRSAVQS